MAFRVDAIVPPIDQELGVDLDDDGSVDDRAGDLLRSLFTTYAEHDVAATWRAQLEERLAERTAWLVEVPGCAPGRVREASLDVPLGALSDLTGTADDGWHPFQPRWLDLAIEGDELRGVVAGGLSDGYQAVIADALLPFLDGLLAAGQSAWAVTLDTDLDGAISRGELLANPAFAIFIAPDLDSDGDGERDALSFALGIRATRS